MEITCYRDQELSSETRHLPAATYNLALTLLSRGASGNLFVPVRAMQYLAILDAEEWVFLDGARKCWVEIAWRHFRPQMRVSLDEPVQYEVVYYQENARELMPRLQVELPRALQDMARKNHIAGPAHVIKFPAPKPAQDKH